MKRMALIQIDLKKKKTGKKKEETIYRFLPRYQDYL